MKLPWKGWARAKSKGPSPAQGRNFRLTLLEWSFLGVVGLGAIYLLVLVAGVGRGTHSPPAQGGVLAQRIKQLEVAHEQLATEVEQLKQLPPLPKGTKAQRAQAVAIARLSRRLARVEAQLKSTSRQLASLTQEINRLKASIAKGPAPKVSAPVPQPETLHALEQAQAQLKAQDQQLRMLRKRVNQLEQALRRVRASRPAPTSLTRLTRPHRVVYQVRRGDTLYRIARRFKVTVGEIRKWNPKLTRRRVLYVGEKLVIYAYGAPSR